MAGETIARASERFGMDASPFNQLLDVREERIKPRELRPSAVLGPYLQAIGTVIDAVDRLEK